QVIVFDFSEISDQSLNLNSKIIEAFGPEGVGLCLIKNVPGYPQARLKLLPLAHKLAHLPQEKLKELTKPEYMHAIGWSHGVEQFKGQYDFQKGSFYANPLRDIPIELTEQQKKNGAFYGPNVWPKDTIPELETVFKNMGKIIVETGSLLSHHIDKYVNSVQANYKIGTLEDIVKNGQQPLARLLHYFASNKQKNIDDDWCGWHNDHAALTGLCGAIYTDSQGNIVEDFSDPEGGLYAKNRFTEIQRIQIPADCLAFQIGETAQIITGGFLEATPHCVVRGSKSINSGVSRNSFAMFMQPGPDYVLNVPDGVSIDQAVGREAYNVPKLKNRWEQGISYLNYSFNSFKSYS
ncbi:hypothetical protein IMG5_206851, partial [Ichthyophthirius multifiliis]